MGQDARPGEARQRPWDWVSWWYSLILPVALLLLIVTLIIDGLGSDPAVSGVVTDAYTGEPVSGARVALGATAVETNGDGKFAFDTPISGALSISHDEYESTQVAVSEADQQVRVQMRPTTLSGRVINVRSGDPVSGATVTVSSPTQASVKTVTDDDGRYLLFDVPADATITVEYPGLTTISQPVNQSTELDFEVRPDVITGVVVDQDGQPLAEAQVEIGGVSAVTGPDGTFQLDGVPESGDIVVKRAGYHDVVAEYPDDMTLEVTLEAFDVRAIYVASEVAGNDEQWDAILDLVERTELNAVVLDVKDGTGAVLYDTSVQLAIDAGARAPVYDLNARLDDLKDREIYAIARVVVFEDPVLPAARPERAIRDLATGDIWTTWDGRAWPNAFDETVWQYNIDIAKEVAEAGFDEVQLDYLRFPTDGPVEVADYGREVTVESRTAAISEFLTRMRAALAPTGTFLAVSVEGTTLWDESDNGIGQDLDMIAPLADVVNPRIYPSHFSPGSFGYDFPNDHPYSVITINMQRIDERFGTAGFKFRAWLQDFSSGLGIDYGIDEVRAQIDAATAHNASGWMLWNATSTYTEGALRAAE